MGATRFVTAIVSAILLYKIGRKPQALISGFGVGATCIFLGCYLHYSAKLTIIPQIAYVVYVAFASLGYYTLPLLIMYEVYPLQVRGLLGGISTSILNVLIFGANQVYPYLRNWIGHENVLLCFGISSLLACLFLFFYLPETKGLTLQEIEEYFNDRRATLVSQRNVIAVQLSGTLIKHREPSPKDKKDTKDLKDPEASALHLKKKKRKKLWQSGTEDDENDSRDSKEVGVKINPS